MDGFTDPEQSEAWAKQLIEEPVEIELPEEKPEEPLGAGVLGLLYLGKLTDSFDYQGHDFVIKTLKIGEELEAALITQEYMQTPDYERALATALVAASIETVDGKPLVTSLGPSEDNYLRHKFEYIKDRWYWTTIGFVYSKYIDLLQKQKEALDEFEKK